MPSARLRTPWAHLSEHNKMCLVRRISGVRSENLKTPKASSSEQYERLDGWSNGITAERNGRQRLSWRPQSFSDRTRWPSLVVGTGKATARGVAATCLAHAEQHDGRGPDATF